MQNIEEEASLYDTQYNEETVLINKVNEMQIKTSRFDQPQSLLLHNNQQNMRSEDYIPNEEPLINVREFWASNLSHNYRMRWPYQQQIGLGGPQLRMRLQHSIPYNNYNYYDQYQIYQMQQNQEPLRAQGNLHNVFNNSRRAFGINNNFDRNRGQSHGPPLRNINGDS